MCYNMHQMMIKGIYMDKQLLNELLTKAGLTKKEFAMIVGTSPASLSNWGTAGRDIPYWVETWLNLYIENKECKELKEKLVAAGICN